jgi:conjugal transfer pilus assembly protein TraE
MEHRRFASTLAEAVRRRNLWMALALMLGAANLLLTGKMLSISTSERIIVTPATIGDTFWVHGEQVSRAYLEQMALFFADLVLTYHKDNFPGRSALFLRHVDPRAHAQLSAALQLEAERIARNSLAQVFHPLSVRVREADRQVALTGELVPMVGEQMLPPRRVTYRLKFSYRDARLFVAEFGETDERDPFADGPRPPADADGDPGGDADSGTRPRG